MALNDIKVLQEQADGSLKETLLTASAIGASAFQPNPDGAAPDDVSDLLYGGFRIPRQPGNPINWHYAEYNSYTGIHIQRESGTSGPWRLSRYYTDDGYEWFSATAIVDAPWPWLATWPDGVVITKFQNPRIVGVPLQPSASEGTSPYVARADHAHPYPTPAQIGASATNHTHGNATTSAAGFLSASDKNKIDKSLSSELLNNSSLYQPWYQNAVSLNSVAGKLIHSVIPPVLYNNQRFDPSRIRNGYVSWTHGSGSAYREIVFAPKQPFYPGIGSLATLTTYLPYSQAPTWSVQGGGSRRVRQGFSVGGKGYAYVLDFPNTGDSASGPEQLELWEQNGLSVLTQRIAVLGPSLGFSWQPSSSARPGEPTAGGHNSSFRLLRNEYDSETGEFYSQHLDARASHSWLTDFGGAQLYPVWNMQWTGGVVLTPLDAMGVLPSAPGSNHVLLSRKNPVENGEDKGSMLGWGPKEGRIFYTNTAQSTVSASSWFENESSVFIWRTTHTNGWFLSGTLTLPSAFQTEIGQRVLLTAINAVASFTLNANGNTIYGEAVPASLIANQTLEWVCVATATWARIR
jgi:hypothetical protein